MSVKLGEERRSLMSIIAGGARIVRNGNDGYVLERNDCSDMVEVMLMVLVEEPCCRKFKAICITDKMILLFINTIILMLNRTMILLVTKCIMDKKTILFIQTPILLINRHGLKKRILEEELWCSVRGLIGPSRNTSFQSYGSIIAQS